MQRTDFLTTFLSGICLLLVAPLLIFVLVQWWVILIIALIITGFAVWKVILENRPAQATYLPPQQGEGAELAPEVLQTIKETLATPYCSKCGTEFENKSSSFCPQCGEARMYKPLSELLDNEADYWGC